MPPPPEDWIAVVERLLGGDRAAFLELNRLITRFLVQWRAYDFRDDWDDLRQEVVMSVVANARAGRLREPQAFVGYVRAITRNKLIDRLKASLRWQEKGVLPWDAETEGMGDGLEADHEARELWTAVQELPNEQQRVLHGIYREGKTYEEVSDETGIPLGTMKRRLRDALAVLRRRLAGGEA